MTVSSLRLGAFARKKNASRKDAKTQRGLFLQHARIPSAFFPFFAPWRLCAQKNSRKDAKTQRGFARREMLRVIAQIDAVDQVVALTRRSLSRTALPTRLRK